MEYAYKFRIYPSKQQETLILRTFGCARYVYNYYLNQRIQAYKNTGKSPSRFEQDKDLTNLKKQGETAWLREVDKCALQNSLKHLDRAYQNFFHSVNCGAHVGFPRFKSKRNRHQSYQTNSNIKVFDDCVQLPKLGKVKCRISKEVKGRILSATVSRNPSGKYFVALCCTDVKIDALPSIGAAVGLDMGIKSFAVTSDGMEYGWDITIDRKVPEAGTEDMAQWHLFLEVQMGDVIKATDKVWINGKQSERTPAISGLVGISRTPSISAYQDPWGVKLTAKNITPSGLTIVCTQQDGEPTGELQTGSYYGLEMLQDGEWVAVELLPMEYELAWTSEAWMIPNNAETEWEVNWSRLYGELPAGSYRISKSVMDFRGTGDYDTKTYYAGFDLVDAADTSNVSYEHGGFGVSVPLLSGWEYKVEEYSADGMSYGVSFRPAGEDGWIDFQYWPTFGVCGTGLSMKEFGNGSMGTYDGGAIWNFISYPASKGNFVATTQGVNSWWSRYGETAMEIITQVICTDTIVD